MNKRTSYKAWTGALALSAAALLSLPMMAKNNSGYRKANEAPYASNIAVQEAHAVFSNRGSPAEREAEGSPTHLLLPGASTTEPPEQEFSFFNSKYPGESETIEWATYDLGLTKSQKRLLYAIRMAENGGPGIEFGIMHDSAGPTTTYRADTSIRRRNNNEVDPYADAPGPSTLAKQARWAALTILSHGTAGRQDISSLAGKYAPIGADNDPRGLNANWTGNVTSFFDRLGE